MEIQPAPVSREETTVKLALVLFLSLTVVAACGTASSRYSKTGVSHDEQRQDQAQCTRVALGRDSPGVFGVFTHIDRDAFDRCMEGRGYSVSSQR